MWGPKPLTLNTQHQPSKCYSSLKQIVTRKEATRLRNQATIQAIIDGALVEKEGAWNAVLDLKFEVRKAFTSVRKWRAS